MKLAIVGIFYDGYYDLWEDFLELFWRNWSDCPYPLYIVNNEKELSFEKQYPVKVLHAGSEAEYSRKVQKAVSEIDADYFLLLLEDFFVEKPIEKDILHDIVETIQSETWNYYKMVLPEFSNGKRKGFYRDEIYPFLYKLDFSVEYTLSCQPSIWKKDFLEQCIGKENYNAWVFEGIYCFAQIAHTEDFLKDCRVDFRNPLQLRHGALQGKLLPTVYEDITATGYIFKTNREVMEKGIYNRRQRKLKIKSMFPLWMQQLIRKVFKIDSVINRYKPEILLVMEKMGLEYMERK